MAKSHSVREARALAARSLVYSRPNAGEPNPIEFAHYPAEVTMTGGFVSLRRIAALSVAHVVRRTRRVGAITRRRSLQPGQGERGATQFVGIRPLRQIITADSRGPT